MPTIDPAPHRPGPPGQWRVLLPVKGTAGAKSRLDVAPGVSRTDLARAMALDAVTAVLACPEVAEVLVVTSDPMTADAVLRAGAEVEPDPGSGLGAAIDHGVAVLAARGDGPLAVLLADLPALRPDDLTAALTACAAYPSAYVPDAEGSGTVLLAAVRPDRLRPSFGAGSAARHDRVAHRLDLDRPRLRRDVDVQDSLRAAIALGVGPRTSAALAAADARWLA